MSRIPEKVSKRTTCPECLVADILLTILLFSVLQTNPYRFLGFPHGSLFQTETYEQPFTFRLEERSVLFHHCFHSPWATEVSP